MLHNVYVWLILCVWCLPKFPHTVYMYDMCVLQYSCPMFTLMTVLSLSTAVCNCNNHSQECVFDEAVYSETGRTSGGVCVNCDGNTDGRQCETCAPYYYPRPDREQTDADVCEGIGPH